MQLQDPGEYAKISPGVDDTVYFPFPSAAEKYEILHKLAEGGMGAVYQVRHRLLDELRVIKVIRTVHAGNERAQRRFEREARAATALRHPNIAQVFDFVAEEDGAYQVMEFIDGLTFRELMNRMPEVPLSLAVELGMQSLDALGYLHQQGFLHRDVAPDNLMLCRQADGRPRVKLIDLGLAKGPAETLDLTASNMFVGKVRYASPELFRRPTFEPSARSDLYSFAVVFYELLTGVCPIAGSSFEELMAAHLLDSIPGFEQTDSDGRVPEKICQVTLAALAKDPEERPATAQSFQRQLTSQPRLSLADFESLWADLRRPGGVLTRNLSTVTSPPPVDASLTTRATQRPVTPVEVAKRQRGGRQAQENVLPTHAVVASRTTQPGQVHRLSRQRLRWWGAGLGLVVALALFSLWLQQQSQTRRDLVAPAARTVGRLQIEASPWAEVLSVTHADGRPVSLDETLYSPAVVVLPGGSYTLRLWHPDLDVPREVEVDVRNTRTLEVFESMVPVTMQGYVERFGLAAELAKAGS